MFHRFFKNIPIKKQNPTAPENAKNILFITLDSLRFDTFQRAKTPNLDKVGKAHKTYSYAPFTYGSHSAMFVGFTPGDPHQQKPFINPKFGKIFRMSFGGFKKEGKDKFILEGRNIVDGFNRQGYTTIGTGAMDWFNPKFETSGHLTDDFENFFFAGPYYLQKQLDFISEAAQTAKSPMFIFMNIGETHTPYYFEGADWGIDDPCLPFSKNNSKTECQKRQKACIEFVDNKLGPLLEQFHDDHIIICGDHGDAWGEDDLWEHGIFHPKVFEVPLILNLK